MGGLASRVWQRLDLWVEVGMMGESVPCVIKVQRSGRSDEPTVIAVTGEIDMATSPALESSLRDLLNVGQVDVVVDMSHVDFIDVIGLETLAGVANRARTLGGKLTLRSPSRQTCRICTLIGLDRILLEEGTEDSTAGALDRSAS